MCIRDRANTADELFDHAVELAEQKGLIARGELVVIAAGVPVPPHDQTAHLQYLLLPSRPESHPKADLTDDIRAHLW